MTSDERNVSELNSTEEDVERWINGTGTERTAAVIAMVQLVFARCAVPGVKIIYDGAGAIVNFVFHSFSLSLDSFCHIFDGIVKVVGKVGSVLGKAGSGVSLFADTVGQSLWSGFGFLIMAIFESIIALKEYFYSNEKNRGSTLRYKLKKIWTSNALGGIVAISVSALITCFITCAWQLVLGAVAAGFIGIVVKQLVKVGFERVKERKNENKIYEKFVEKENGKYKEGLKWPDRLPKLIEIIKYMNVMNHVTSGKLTQEDIDIKRQTKLSDINLLKDFESKMNELSKLEFNTIIMERYVIEIQNKEENKEVKDAIISRCLKDGNTLEKLMNFFNW